MGESPAGLPRGIPQRLIVRDLDRAPALPDATAVQASGYDDAAAMQAALDGVSTLFFASASEHPERVKLHTAVVDAAATAGVTRIIYTSFAGRRRGRRCPHRCRS